MRKRSAALTAVFLAGSIFIVPVCAESSIPSLKNYVLPNGIAWVIPDDGSAHEKMTVIDYNILDAESFLPRLWASDQNTIRKDQNNDGQIDYISYGKPEEEAQRGWFMSDKNADGNMDYIQAWEKMENSDWQFKASWQDLDENGTLDVVMLEVPVIQDGITCGIRAMYFDCAVEPELEIVDYTHKGEWQCIYTFSGFPNHPLEEQLTYVDYDGDGYADWGKRVRYYDTNNDGINDSLKQEIDHNMDDIFEDSASLSDSLLN